MRRLAAVLVLLPAVVAADWWIEDTGRGYRSIGGASRLGPYASREQAEKVNQEYSIGGRVTGSDSPAAGASSGGGGGSTGDPAMDAMMPLLQQGASLFGQALGRALFGDPAEKARRAAQDDAQRRSDQRFRQDMDAIKRRAPGLRHARYLGTGTRAAPRPCLGWRAPGLTPARLGEHSAR